jgi:hypothetical protein
MNKNDEYTLEDIFAAIMELSEDEKEVLLKNYKVDDLLYAQNNKESYDGFLEHIKDHINKMTLMKLGMIHLNITLKMNKK